MVLAEFLLASGSIKTEKPGDIFRIFATNVIKILSKLPAFFEKKICLSAPPLILLLLTLLTATITHRITSSAGITVIVLLLPLVLVLPQLLG